MDQHTCSGGRFNEAFSERFFETRFEIQGSTTGHRNDKLGRREGPHVFGEQKCHGVFNRRPKGQAAVLETKHAVIEENWTRLTCRGDIY